jgi:hypothetical protein
MNSNETEMRFSDKCGDVGLGLIMIGSAGLLSSNTIVQLGSAFIVFCGGMLFGGGFFIDG